MIDYVDMKTNTCIFGYGGIAVEVINTTIILKGIKPPVGAGTFIWNDDGEKIGEWEYDGSKISVTFYTMSELKIVCDWLKNIEENQGGSFKFKDVAFDFIVYKQASMDVVKRAMEKVRSNMMFLMAC